MLSVNSSTQRLRLAGVCLATALAVFTYLPAQLLPFISDDYVHIAVARDYGPVSGWSKMAADPLYRHRALSSICAYWTEQLFGLSAIAFNLSSLVFHVAGVLALASLGIWRRIGWAVSLPAAAFFAVAEGHQEAVVWYASLPELQVFVFVVLAFLCWVMWLEQPGHHGRWWYAGSVVAFLGALLSKESAVCVAGLQVLVLAFSRFRDRRGWLGFTPFAAVSAAYFGLIYSTRTKHQFFQDGTFDLSAPFLTTMLLSLLRLYWFWGFIALAILLLLTRKRAWPAIALTLGWAVVTLLPYSFLTYLDRVPSRHTYLASAGVALLVGAAYAALRSRRWQGVAALLAAVAIAHNVGYLWTKKQQQYEARAASTEELVRVAQKAQGGIVIECFPYHPVIATTAVRMRSALPPSQLTFDLQPGCGETLRYRLEPASDNVAEVQQQPLATVGFDRHNEVI